jgi:hypothetical protein
MDMKVCRKCGIEKNLSEFVKNKQSKGGVTHTCKECEKSWNQAYYEANKDYIVARNKKYREINPNWYSTSVEKRMRYILQLGVARARDKKIEWSLSVEFLVSLWEKQKGCCAYSGVPLTYEENHPHTVSLDRIDSLKGYTEENVQLVCTIVNYIKQRFDEKTFFTFCKSVAQNNK